MLKRPPMPEDLRLRDAERDDLPAIINLIADDPFAAERESQDPAIIADAYTRAFDAICADQRQRLIVAVSEGKVVGCLQLTFIPGLTYIGGTRAQIEGVRIARRLRGSGAGRMMIEHAISLARDYGCVLVQLTTDKRRPKALFFYQSLGFTASHEGMKLRL